MADFSVLVHFGERKKVVKIPSSCCDHYTLLCEAVFEWTGDTVEYLERFDAEWDEWIEVEEKTFVACDKDHVEAVVLTVIKANESLEGSASGLIQQNSKIEELRCYNRSPDTDMEASCGKCCSNESEDDHDEEGDLMHDETCQDNLCELEEPKREIGLLPSTSSAEGNHKSGGPVGQMLTTTPNMKLKRDRGVEQPLPNPFPLPLHYPSTVEAGLIAENPGIVPKYLSCVASSMLCHKMYPTREEYSQVANEIIRKYPWMKSKLGPPTGAIVISIQNRFKEFRRDRKSTKCDARTSQSTSNKTPSTSKQITATKSPHVDWMQPPTIPLGEDNCSFERFSSQLREESKRKQPRGEIISKLMEATYAHRRKNILECPSTIPELLKKYPFLSAEAELLKDLDRIAGKSNLTEEMTRSWNDNLAPKIMKLKYHGRCTTT